MTKHAHRASNLANEDVDLVGTVDQTWSYFCGSATLITFKFACKSICSFGETSEQESFFIEALFAVFRPLFGRFDGEELSFITAEVQKQLEITCARDIAFHQQQFPDAKSSGSIFTTQLWWKSPAHE